MAVNHSGSALKHVPYALRTIEMYRQAVTSCWSALKEVPAEVQAQYPDLVDIALRKHADALKFVHHQTLSMCEALIRRYPPSLVYVKEQTPELCFEAVRRSYVAIAYVRNRTPEILAEAEAGRLREAAAIALLQ
jgi:hypothetical protein